MGVYQVIPILGKNVHPFNVKLATFCQSNGIHFIESTIQQHHLKVDDPIHIHNHAQNLLFEDFKEGIKLIMGKCACCYFCHHGWLLCNHIFMLSLVFFCLVANMHFCRKLCPSVSIGVYHDEVETWETKHFRYFWFMFVYGMGIGCPCPPVRSDIVTLGFFCFFFACSEGLKSFAEPIYQK